MTLARFAGFGFAMVAAAGVLSGCMTDNELAVRPVGEDGTHVEGAVLAGSDADSADAGAAAELARLAETRQSERTQEAGVTVIRGAMPPALAGMAAALPSERPASAPVPAAERISGPARGGSLVAAATAEGGAVHLAAAPGALASADQLASLRAQPAIPVQTVALDDDPVDDVSPAAGNPAVTQLTDSGDPVVDEIRQRAAHSPVSVEELEARGASRMTTEEIEALSVGNTVTHINADNGFSVATYFDPNGQSRLINDGRGLPSRYQISDGARCRIDSQGIGVCALLYRDGDTTWVCDQRDQGMCTWYVSNVRPGLVTD